MPLTFFFIGMTKYDQYDKGVNFEFLLQFDEGMNFECLLQYDEDKTGGINRNEFGQMLFDLDSLETVQKIKVHDIQHSCLQFYQECYTKT
jgi:hypothetical protein